MPRNNWLGLDGDKPVSTRGLVYKTLRDAPEPMTRGEIAKRTGMPMSTVSARVSELLDASYICYDKRRLCTVTEAAANPLRLT